MSSSKVIFKINTAAAFIHTVFTTNTISIKIIMITLTPIGASGGNASRVFDLLRYNHIATAGLGHYDRRLVAGIIGFKATFIGVHTKRTQVIRVEAPAAHTMKGAIIENKVMRSNNRLPAKFAVVDRGCIFGATFMPAHIRPEDRTQSAIKRGERAGATIVI